MRKINLLILILVLTVSAFAQIKQPNKAAKVALINTNIFDDMRQGIKILVKAKRSYSLEYYKLNSLTERISKLDKEMNYLLSQSKPINEKFIELQQLKVELKNAEAEKKSEYERKYSIVVMPIVEKITKKMWEFAKLKGYAIIIDKSQGSILVEVEVEDITKDFIQFCNESFEKEKSQ